MRGLLYYLRRVSIVGGVTLMAFVTAGLQAPFSSTVLQTWWIWAYDLPKHLIPLVGIAWLLGRGVDRGLDAYARGVGYSFGPGVSAASKRHVAER